MSLDLTAEEKNGDDQTAEAAPIRFRPHHFLCALGFQGKGYSDSFTANMYAIVFGRLKTPDGADQRIRLTGHTDDICAPCPKRRGRLCTNEQAIKTLDRRHAAALRLQPREELSWGEALDRIRTHVPPGSLTTLCAGCRWLPLGLCEGALAELHAERPAGCELTDRRSTPAEPA